MCSCIKILFKIHLFTSLSPPLSLSLSQINTDVNHKVKDYNQVRLQAQKAKERYFVAAAEWEASLMMIHKEFGAVWEPVAGNKLYEKEQQVCRKVDEVSFFIYFGALLVYSIAWCPTG